MVERFVSTLLGHNQRDDHLLGRKPGVVGGLRDYLANAAGWLVLDYVCSSRYRYEVTDSARGRGSQRPWAEELHNLGFFRGNEDEAFP